MDSSKLGRLIGTILVGMGILGLAFAIGNLASLPSIQRQLLEAVPAADTAIADAVSQSQSKSYSGLAIFGALLVCGGALIVVCRQRPSAKPINRVEN
jgi:hypothetical protein